MKIKISAMKRIISLFLFIGVFGCLNAQINPYLSVKKYTLENGLTVYLNEDHSKPEIFGAVVVNAGGKNDPKDATGIAHYFEHMMFKGTDRIGTLNWQTEKIYLDSISMLYDQLAQTTADSSRKAIQLHINQISLKAAEYAIPNEVDLILQNIGGTGLNAYTAEERTVYFNSFPANQIEKWLDIYSERFRNPVFRLFQSELETVYEEKNMYADNPFSVLYEAFLKELYKNHPYGQQPIIGFTEHLKNPRLSKMMEFFRTYYVANNMALILTGNFDSEKVIPMINEKFGKWAKREVPKFEVPIEKPFVGREEVNVKLTPIAIGIMAFRAVPNNHPDELVFDLCSEILSNQGETGFFNKLVNENNILMAQAQPMLNNDLGSILILFAPKIVGQKLETAEQLVLQQLDRLKKGDFSDELLEGIKLNYRKNIERQIESTNGRAMMLIDCFIEGRKWDDLLALPDRIDKITKADIMRVANLYFTNNYLMFNSKMGFPKKDKIEKPDWKPVVPQNNNKKSDYAEYINKIPEIHLAPKFINFKKECSYSQLRSGVEYYHTPNPYNKVFSLTLKYKVGSAKNKKYEYATNYMNYIGTKDKSLQQLKAAFQNLGATINFYSNENYTYVYIDGFDNKLSETLALIAELFSNPKADDKPIKKFVEEEKASYKQIVSDPESVGDALAEYAKYKEKSDYLDKLNASEIKKLKGEELITLFKEILMYEAEIHYVGSLYENDVKLAILNVIPFALTTQKAYYEEKTVEKYSKPIVYIYNNPKAIQSKIYLFSNGDVADETDKALLNGFNEYFGGGMSSIVFQEIREFRSLGYSAYAYYYTPTIKTSPGYLSAYLGTQNDKAVEGTEALYNLITNMPEKPDRMDVIRRGLIQAIHTQNPSFRYISSTISNWKFKGYESDPRESQMKVYESIQFEDIVKTYKKFVQGKNIVITVSGDFKKINKKAFEKYGTIIELKMKDFIKK